MTRHRILFVDDEVPVLEGLQNLLRKYRTVWEMVFVSTGKEALECLAQSPFDVVVSDMRMPGMDGADLLNEVKAKYPSSARLILSGHADREAVLRALPVAHQYLSKPCDAELLRQAIERTCALQSRLHNDPIRAVVGMLAHVPSMPQVYWDLTAILAREDVSVAAVAAVVERDPAMVAKVLQLVNSAYFGLARRITSIEQAVMYLGVQLVRSLALTVHVFGSMPVSAAGFSFDSLQRNSLWTARLARKLAANPAEGEDAFAASLMRDLGQVILASASPAQFAQAVATAAATGQSLHDVERAAFGSSHAEIGAYLLGVWGLPIALVEAVAYHHVPNESGAESRSLLRAVHAAGALVEWAIAEGAGAPATDTLDLDFMAATGGLDGLPAWRELARTEVQTALDARAGVR